jgi:hypothetical protein
LITYTKQETKALEAIEEKYRPQLKAAMAEMNKYDISKQREEWIAASNRYIEITSKMRAEQEVYFKRAELRSFNSFNGDVARVVEAVKSQVQTFIYVSKALAGDEPTAKERAKQQKRIEKGRKELKEGIEHNEKLLEQFPDDQELIKCTEELKEVDPAKVHEFYYDTIYSEQALHERIKESFAIYFEFLSKTSQEAYKELQDFIDETIKNRDKLDPSKIDITDIDPKAIINTFYPVNFLTPTDKVSNLAFSNELTGGQIQQLAMERRGSKKQITTLASIDFEKLNGSVEIKSRKELTAYDREVHDAIITLFVDGGNEYITPQMIYQVMTGNPDAYLNPKQAEAISESITKCMYSRLIIDASEEAKAYGFDSFKYDGNLISGERVTATLNGTVAECLRILRPPVLYDYANKKNQIGRFDIKLLNSPINKTEEIITLQGYLYRRILSMKGSSNLSKTIVYDTVYKQIDVTAASDGALRKKKSKVRDQVKKILDYWIKESFISGYTESKRGQVIYSITIEL